MTETETAWLAGLFEGEGCITLNKQGRAGMGIAMTDEDIIRRAQKVTGMGNITVHLRNSHYKTRFHWRVGKHKDVMSLLTAMLPYLGIRRSEKARFVMQNARVPLPPRTHCPHGHPYHGSNLGRCFVRGKFRFRYCRACRSEYARRKWAERERNVA